MFARYPFLRILTPFIIGILASNDTTLALISWVILFWIVLVLLEKFGLLSKWKNRIIAGILIQLLLFGVGFFCRFSNKDIKNDISNETSKLVHLQKLDKSGKVYDRYISTVYFKKRDLKWEKIRCYVYISSKIHNIHSGVIFVTINQPQKIKQLYNPGGFDFATYTEQKQIYYTLYINNDREFIKFSYKKNNRLYLLEEIRKWIIHTLQVNIRNPTEAALTEALLIGYKEDLDKTLQEQYTVTGVSHIIAVSGMHLGLIFYVLTAFIGSFTNKKTGRLIGLCFILPLLWAFALITGASASVLRSVVVFTIMLFGNAMLKKAESINTLLASAFFLLVAEPGMIKDIGFQLSYTAVLSIIIFEPIVSKWLYIKNKILNYLWNMIAITIAAQILTTPVVLYHFQQFPVLFLLTNLIAVPLSSLVLLLAIGVCLLSLANLPISLLAEIIHICLTGMNTYIGKMATIPFNSLQISISISTMILCYVLIAISTITFTSKKIGSIFPLVAIMFALGVSHHTHSFVRSSIKRIMVLHIKNETCIIHQHGRSAQIYCSKTLFNDSGTMNSKLNQIKKHLGVESIQMIGFKNQPAVIRIKAPNSKKNTVIMRATDISLEQLLQLDTLKFSNPIVIADGSNKLWKIRQWEKQAHELHLRLYSTQEMGAFILPCEHK